MGQVWGHASEVKRGVRQRERDVRAGNRRGGCRMAGQSMRVGRRSCRSAVNDVLLTLHLENRGDALHSRVHFGLPQHTARIDIERADDSIARAGEDQSSCGHNRTDLRQMSACLLESFRGELRNFAERFLPLDGAGIEIVRSQGGPGWSDGGKTAARDDEAESALVSRDRRVRWSR